MKTNPRLTRLITIIRWTRRLIAELTTLLIAVAGLAGVILSLTR
jgi:hypothetical protein